MMFSDMKDVQLALAALEEAAIIISFTDAEGIIRSVNPNFCQVSKYEQQELIGKPHSMVKSGYHPDSFFRTLWETVSAGKVWRGEMKNRAKDGSEYWVGMTLIPIKSEETGLPVQYMAIGLEITDRKQNEALIEDSMQNLRDIENALDASSIVAITDNKGVITYVNDKFCEISKYDRSELIGRTHRVINSGYHPKSFFQTMWKTIKQGQVWRDEVKNRAKDGSEYWMNTTIVPFLGEDGVPHQFISIRSDITDRVKAETALAERTKQLASAHDEAIKANMIKSQFLANMSHELRTPLNAIIGYSEMLMEEAEDMGEQGFVEDLGKISKAGNHLLALINDILDISKIEAGKVELHLEPCHLPSLIQDVMTTMLPLIEGRGNLIEMYCTEGDMVADVTKLRQILINLLSNANKFTEAGSISFHVYEEARGGLDGYCFMVKDTGIGMTPAQLDKLFLPFSQADASTTRKYGGTGLGLAISQSFSQLMGGRIEVESEFGIGTTFSCWLPANQDSREALLPHAGEPQIAIPAQSGPVSILLIDDEASNRSLMERYLARTGWTLAYADNGIDGLRLAKQLRPKVICLDILMPSMDGWSVLTALKADPELADLPVVIWSLTNDKHLGFSLGAAEFLTKPVQRDRFVQVMERFLAERE